MQSTYQGTFVAESFTKSKFKPKKAVSTVEEISSVLKLIFDDVTDITNIYNDLVSKSVNSSEWIATAQQIATTSNEINIALKNMATNIIEHITEAYEQADSLNKLLSFEIEEHKESLANVLSKLQSVKTGNLKAPSISNYEASIDSDVQNHTQTPEEVQTETKNNIEIEKNIVEENVVGTNNENSPESENFDKTPVETPTTPSSPNSRTTDIPDNVKQSGITKNYTNYDYFYNKWSNNTNQRTVANQWNDAGRTSDRGIATLNDRYLVAVSQKFGNVGDNIDVVLEDGTIINCTIADAKGSDATSEWGHVLGGGGVDVIEWESVGGADVINVDEWKGKKVSSIINNNC